VAPKKKVKKKPNINFEPDQLFEILNNTKNLDVTREEFEGYIFEDDFPIRDDGTVNLVCFLAWLIEKTKLERGEKIKWSV